MKIIKCTVWLLFFAIMASACSAREYKLVKHIPFTKEFESGRVTSLRDGRSVEYVELGKIKLRTGYVVIDDATYFMMDYSQQLRLLPGLYTVYEIIDESGGIAGLDIQRGATAIRRRGSKWFVQTNLNQNNKGEFGYWDAFDTQRVAICDQFMLYDIDLLIERMQKDYGVDGWRYWHYEDHPRKVSAEMGININNGHSDVLVSNTNVYGGEIFVEKNPGEDFDRMLFIYLPEK